jgi:hypothetical protein
MGVVDVARQDATASAGQVGRVARSEGAKRFLQAGWAAKGVVYVLVAVIALQVAAGGSGERADQQGAIAKLAPQPLGRVLLFVVAAGLVLYALSRLGEAAGVVGPEEDNAAARAGYVLSAALYGAVAVTAFAAGARGGSRSSQGGEPSGVTARLMENSVGRGLVGLVGLVLVGVAAYFAYKGVKRKFLEELRTGEMPATARPWVERLGVVGHVARGVVFAIMGWFLVRAAVQYDSAEAVGLDGALRRLAGQPYGPWLLVVTALGLLAYGAFCFVNARYRRTG